jgi:O-antigen/teichoic acid export membrane protein
LALLDQGIVSIANFLTSVIISRIAVAPKDELGIYGLGFTIVVLVAGIPKALVWTPYTAHWPRIEPLDRSRYSASVTLHMIAISLLTACGLGVVALCLSMAKLDAALTRLFVCLAPSLIVMLLREHVRRLCLAWMRLVEVLCLDAFISILQVAGVWVLLREGQLTGANAYLAVCAANIPALAWIVWRAREFTFDRKSIWRHAHQNWNFSKWIFAGAVAVLLSNGLYRWLLKFFHGTSAVGDVTSVQNIILVVNPILLGIANYLAPASATVYAVSGKRALERFVIRASLLLAAALGLFYFGLAAVGETVIEYAFGPAFGGQGPLVMILACGLFSEALLMPIEVGILTAERGDFLFRTAILRLVVTATLGAVLVWRLEAFGLGWGMLVGNGLALAWEWFVFHRVTRNG